MDVKCVRSLDLNLHKVCLLLIGLVSGGRIEEEEERRTVRNDPE